MSWTTGTGGETSTLYFTPASYEWTRDNIIPTPVTWGTFVDTGTTTTIGTWASYINGISMSEIVLKIRYLFQQNPNIPVAVKRKQEWIDDASWVSFCKSFGASRWKVHRVIKINPDDTIMLQDLPGQAFAADHFELV